MISPVFRNLRKGVPHTCALIVGAALALWGPGARCQGFDATTLRQPADLAAGWLVHAGDDPAYAQPDFDDSGWTPFNAETGSLHTIFQNSQPEVVWYRLHIKLAPDEHSLSLHTAYMARAFEIYVNGTRLAAAGNFSPYVPYDTSGQQVIPIPQSLLAGGFLLIALRIHVDRIEWDYPQPGYRPSQLTFGQLEGMREHMWYRTFGLNALGWIDGLVNLGMMLGALMLYSTQRNRPEYLWLSLTVAVKVPAIILGLYSLFHMYPLSWNIVGVLFALSPYLMARMYCAFVCRRIGWKLNLFLILCCLSWAYFFLHQTFGVESLNDNLFIWLPETLLEMVILPWILIVDVRSGHRESAFLLIPLILAGLWGAGEIVLPVVIQVPSLRDAAVRFAQRWEGARFGPFIVYFYVVADLLSMLSLALIILIRSNRMSRQQAVLESEMASAREVQQVILPEAVESIPGFKIESVYEPAREVGGDFFQIVPVANEGFVLVIGDVAGKGLPAAMLVSVLVGAIRTAVRYDHAPASVLGQLNERLVGRANGGFSTALAALFAADGSVAIANAGHLPPYLDGREVELKGTLPLGIDRGASYEATTLRLEPGGRLTFYSDGVIEAQDKNGELFGFERGREISTRAAKDIAEAAKSFGQQDDITVIKVERVAVEERRTAVQTAPVCAPA